MSWYGQGPPNGMMNGTMKAAQGPEGMNNGTMWHVQGPAGNMTWNYG